MTFYYYSSVLCILFLLFKEKLFVQRILVANYLLWEVSLLLTFLKKLKAFILHPVTITLINGGVIVAGVYWSTLGTTVSIYDKYNVALRGVVLPVADVSKTLAFYTETLGFRAIERDNFSTTPFGIELAGSGQIFLEPTENGEASPHKSSVYFVAKGNIQNLHSAMSSRLGKVTLLESTNASSLIEAQQKLTRGSISDIFYIDNPKTKLFSKRRALFYVMDIDGNVLQFSR